MTHNSSDRLRVSRSHGLLPMTYETMSMPRVNVCHRKLRILYTCTQQQYEAIITDRGPEHH